MNVKVLCYHRVNDKLKQDINLLAVSTDNFRAHMEWLKNNFELLRFEEEWDIADKDGVVITFDDGYKDFIENALPILEEMNIPATIFVSTMKNQDLKMMWWDELEYLIFSKNMSSFHLVDEEFEYSWDLTTVGKRKKCYEALHFLMKNAIDLERRDNWLIQLWKTVGETRTRPNQYTMLDDKDIKYLINHQLITIGVHTDTHPTLRMQDHNTRKKEIEESIKILTDKCERAIETFSYPFGKYMEDYDEYDNEICKKCGIIKTASTNYGCWRFGDDYYNIKRIGVNNKDINDFINYIRAVDKC